MKKGGNGGQSASINARHLDSILAGQNASQKRWEYPGIHENVRV
jgi:hypothetical protein